MLDALVTRMMSHDREPRPAMTEVLDALANARLVDPVGATQAVPFATRRLASQLAQTPHTHITPQPQLVPPPPEGRPRAERRRASAVLPPAGAAAERPPAPTPRGRTFVPSAVSVRTSPMRKQGMLAIGASLGVLALGAIALGITVAARPNEAREGRGRSRPFVGTCPLRRRRSRRRSRRAPRSDPTSTSAAPSPVTPPQPGVNAPRRQHPRRRRRYPLCPIRPRPRNEIDRDPPPRQARRGPNDPAQRRTLLSARRSERRLIGSNGKRKRAGDAPDAGVAVISPPGAGGGGGGSATCGATGSVGVRQVRDGIGRR